MELYHELAHLWWKGKPIHLQDPQPIDEGLANYTAYLAIRKFHGKEDAFYILNWWNIRAKTADNWATQDFKKVTNVHKNYAFLPVSVNLQEFLLITAFFTSIIYVTI